MMFKLVYISCFLPIISARDYWTIGGINIKSHVFPHQVSLQRTPTGVSHFCSGSIIFNTWVITTARCNFGKTLYAKAGKVDLKQSESTEQTREVDKVFLDPIFKDDSDFDIALLKLKQPFEFNENVLPIRIPEANKSVTGDVILSGWGFNNSRLSTPSNILQNITAVIMDSDLCRRIHTFSKFRVKLPLEEIHLCTSPGMDNGVFCGGDAGSPLVKIRGDEAELVGLATRTSCRPDLLPISYIKVSAFVAWIEDIMSKN